MTSFFRCIGLSASFLVTYAATGIAVATPSASASASDTKSFSMTPAAAPAPINSALRPALDVTEFPRPEILKPNIGFWTQIFSHYSEFQSVIHSMDRAEKVYVVLDFRDDAARLGVAEARRQQAKAEKAVKRELDRHLKRVHQFRDNPEQLTPIERKVHALFDDRSDPERYRKAMGRFRAQRGLKESTQRALQVSGQYLPSMEGIFKREGLPLLLTRLPLVESSFNVEAYSKVGAAGLWQFIPSSARIYMRLDEAVDDRRDPWTSTQAAARHLKEDYAELGSWPLAITAYNHGRAGLARGLREVNGKGLEDLLERWDGRRFGFASRNFYAEFLAASDVERESLTHFGELERQAPLEYEVVQTGHYVSYATLQRCAGIDAASFRKLNLGFRPEVLDGRLHVPPQSTLRLPVGTSAHFKAAYATLGDSERYSQQRFYYVRYKVRSGDNLGGIARRYGVSLSSLKQANGIGKPKLLRTGQVLRIPPRATGRTLQLAAFDPTRKNEIDGMRLGTHRVQTGQSLSTIAQQYRTTIAVLTQLNGLNHAQLLRSGSMLKVPAH